MTSSQPPDGYNGTKALSVTVLARAVYPVHGYGGLERHVYDLIRHLVDCDVAVTVVTRPPAAGRGDPAQRSDSSRAQVAPTELFRHPRLRYLWVPYHTFPFAGRRGTTVLDRSTAYLWFGYRAGHVAAQVVAGDRTSVVYGLGASALGYALVRGSHENDTAPFVFNPQGLEEFGGAGTGHASGSLKRLGYWPLQRAVRRCARSADRVIATDRVLEPMVCKYLDVARQRVSVVPNAIDLRVCDQLASAADGAGLRTALGYTKRDILLLSVGRLERNKGFHVLAEALARLPDANWRWVVVGDGPFRGRLEQLVKHLGLVARVSFLGRTSDRELHAWYEAATLFVHPTLYEGSSLVTLEAMSHRRAVLASRAGGLPDKVQPGLTGWLVEPGDPEALARALGEALRDRERLWAMGCEGRGLVEREFSWTTVTPRLLNVYNEVLAERDRRLPRNSR